MEAGDPRFPEYPGWGPRASHIPSLPSCLRFLSLPPPPGATGLSGAQSVPGALLCSPPRPRSWRPNFRARVSHSAPCQCAVGKGLSGATSPAGTRAGRAPRGAWVGTRAWARTSGAVGALAPRRSRGAGAGPARWRVPGTHAAHACLPAAPRDAVAAAVRRPPSSCSRRRADPRWLRAPWSPTASFPPPG